MAAILFLNLFFYSFMIITLASASSVNNIASDQLKFWSQNVKNEIPKPILKKLSPLTQSDTDYYTNLLLSKNSKFSADPVTFCTKAKLACHTVFDDVKKVKEAYNVEKTYGQASAALHRQASKTADPFSFFRLSVLKNGNLVHLPHLHESLPERAFLPTQMASKIPLNYDAITKIFPDSDTTGKTKQTIQTTLAYCDGEAIQGETKSCPKSLEELINFAKRTLGNNKKLVAVTSTNTRGSNSVLTIGKIKEYYGDDDKKVVACHEAFLPFAAYFCHSLSKTRLYEVEFVDRETGSNVNTMLGICHMDTSPWPKNHVAFEILKFGPGEGEACHWFTQLDLAWIADVSL